MAKTEIVPAAAMRRGERALTTREAIAELLGRSEICRIAWQGEDGYPYILPLNFGWDWPEDGPLQLYIHGAKEGRRQRLLAEDARVGVEFDGELRLVPAPGPCGWTMHGYSVVGAGRMAALSEPQAAARAMAAIMRQYGGPEGPFDDNSLAQARLFVITLSRISAKRIGGTEA